MSQAAIEHVRIQHAVGQGGFHAAYVKIEDEGSTYRFDYVYDCGALKHMTLPDELKRAVESYEPRSESVSIEDNLVERSVIDALIISHFDYDHMNGAQLLSDKHNIRRVYIPYLDKKDLLLQILTNIEEADVGATGAEFLEPLFEAVYATELWGAKITRVHGGNNEDRFRGDEFDEAPNTPRRDENSDGPGPLVERNARTKNPIGPHLNHTDSVELIGNKTTIWKLRFWNYRCDSDLAQKVTNELNAIGFPVNAVNSASGAKQIIDWFLAETPQPNITKNKKHAKDTAEAKKRRDDAVKAYKHALKAHAKATGIAISSEGTANLISLALFSGPEKEIPQNRLIYWPSGPDYCWKCNWGMGFDLRRSRYGWLGTGDAPLGEPDVWDEFEAHYILELPETLTVLIPHHGAAPKDGPSFYNPKLNAWHYTVTVISVGATNTYKHPRPSVIASILGNLGLLRVVSEYSWPGLIEMVRTPWEISIG